MTVPLSDWRALERELDAWGAAGRQATLWWRDDDAVAPSPALDRLLGLAETNGLPLALAAIPARLAASLPGRLAHHQGELAVLQHGFAHRNHADPDRKKQELGAQRPAAAVLEELARGSALLTAAFAGASLLPVLVPPWNRLDDALIPELAALGFAGLSIYGPRPAAAVAGLVQVNAHADIMHWPAPRGFLGEAESLRLVTGHLGARRTGSADPEEPTGLLTHHLAHDAAAWQFLERLLPLLARHPAAAWPAPAAIFAAPPVRQQIAGAGA